MGCLGVGSEDNIKMDLKQTGCQNGEWISLAKDGAQLWALVNRVHFIRFLRPLGLHFNEPLYTLLTPIRCALFSFVHGLSFR